MKKAIYVIGCVLSIAFVSCSKGEYSSGDGQTGYNRFADVNNQQTKTPTGTFTAKINDAPFTAGYSNAYYINVDLAKGIDIVGYKSTTVTAADGFSIHLQGNTKGIYNVDLAGGSLNVITYKATGASSSVMAETGKVEITDITDKNIKGTFEMQATGFTVTEGKFDVPIIAKVK